VRTLVTSRFVCDAGAVSDHDLTRGVAVRLSALCLDEDGGLRDYTLWDMAIRGALLLDLALADRVTHEADSVAIDATPTGFPPADALLAPIAVEPERPLDWWIDHGAVDLVDVVSDNVAAGRWTVRRRLLGRRYAVADDGTAEADGRRHPHQPAAEWDAATAALMAVADAAGISDGVPGDEPREAMLVATESVRWLSESVVERLRVAHLHFRGTVGIA
jgi:hypothetical protein